MIVIKVDVTQPVLDFDGVTVVNHQRLVQREVLTGEIGDDGKPKTGIVQDVIEAVDTEGNPKPFTIRNAIAKAVQTLTPEERKEGCEDHPPEIRDDVFKVMCRISAAGSNLAELDDDDRALILSRAEVNLNALLKGRVIEALEGGEKVSPSRNNGKGKIDKRDLAAVE